MNIAILSNINIESIIRKLKKIHNTYTVSGYGTWINEVIDKNSELYVNFNPNNIFIILDGEQLINNINKYKNIIDENINYIESAISNNVEIKFFIANIDMNLIQIEPIKNKKISYDIEYYWHLKLDELNKKYDNIYTFDFKNIIELYGRQNIYSSKMWYLSSNKYSLQGEKIIIEEINNIISCQLKSNKKCILLDLDNTLWGGVLGEEGIDGIELDEYNHGARYKDFQKKLKELKELGVILGIVSKNNHEDVIEIFEHKHMYLKEDDFVIIKANWNHKSENIIQISKELNIGIESIVFIDDNKLEREEIKSTLPLVTVPEFPEDTSQLNEFAYYLYKNYFYKLTVSKEDGSKTIMYKQNLERENFKNRFELLDSYYRGLDIKIKIEEASERDITRIYQMIQKTNQFNFTTKRYTEIEIYNFLKSNEKIIYIVNVEDKFGSSGKSGLVILNIINEQEVEIDTFLLSCRIMGKTIELEIINYIEANLKQLGYKIIKAKYIETKKNIPVKNFFDNIGYKLDKESSLGEKTYYFKLYDRRKKLKSYARLK